MSQRTLLLVLLVISLVSVLAVYSSTRGQAGNSYAVRQLIWIGVGVVAMLIMSVVRIKTLSALSPVIYALSLLALVLVLIVGKGPYGTRRWFDLGPLSFQPSEPAKIAVILMLARYLSDRGRIGDSIKSVIVALAIAAVPAALILNQPDLGTAMVMGLLVFPMLYASGMDPLYLLFLVSPFIAILCAGEIVAWAVFVCLLLVLMILGKFKTSLVALLFGVNFVLYSLAPRLWATLAPYQQDRVLAFLHPDSYRHGAGFQLIQSQIAIGSGGLTGKGLFRGTQKALGLVPAQHTDFIFSLVGEELGFVGGLAVLLLLLFVVLRVLKVAGTVKNRFASLFCFGFAGLVLMQISINIGMNLGMTPVTGLPLPFISYGGSQIMVFWGAIGIVISAYASRREY
jgi:rod shape determining protein RodA